MIKAHILSQNLSHFWTREFIAPSCCYHSRICLMLSMTLLSAVEPTINDSLRSPACSESSWCLWGFLRVWEAILTRICSSWLFPVKLVLRSGSTQDILVNFVTQFGLWSGSFAPIVEPRIYIAYISSRFKNHNMFHMWAACFLHSPVGFPNPRSRAVDPEFISPPFGWRTSFKYLILQHTHSYTF